MQAATTTYKEAALERLLLEVNQIALELNLPERLPIKQSDLLEVRINTPFWSDSAQQFGVVSTSNYYYFASAGNRLSSIEVNFGPNEIRGPAYNESLRKRYAAPRTQVDTNAAYTLAVQLMTKAGIDVKALERDAQQTEISFWEVGSRFVPVYSVVWRRLAAFRGDSQPKLEALASIQLLVPEQRVIRMNVKQAKYIKRSQLKVADRDRLLQQTGDSKLRELWFTTEQYKAAVVEAILREANWAASALHLPEQLPIVSSNLTEVKIGSPYMADHGGNFATIGTEKYRYSAGEKLNYVGRSHADYGGEEYYFASLINRYAMPSDRFNPAMAYNLATQWLSALTVDLKRLETEYRSEVSPVWMSEGKFIPLYKVEWVRPVTGSRRRDVAVMVEILAPENTLEQIHIVKPEYMTRSPLVLSNRESLLQVAVPK